MTDPFRNRPALRFAPDGAEALPLYLLEPDAPLPAALTPAQRAFAQAQGFAGALGSLCLLPDAQGGIAAALFGYGTAARRRRGRYALAGVAAKLPAGNWRIVADLPPGVAEVEALGWLLEGYRFDDYAALAVPEARLVCPEGLDPARIEVLAEGEALTRDLINTPPNDMGPEELDAAIRAVATRHGAEVTAVVGDDLLARGYPLIHAVGRASPRAPRLLDLRWGEAGPELTLVGKGVCFDTGGLDIKPPSSMGLMKKDMGGAATVLGLAHMIMALKLPLRLRVLIPAVENAVGGAAFRPQDIYTSRKGLTVEINNTDAEGRLVLADALAAADEESPDLILCMATLTGAARVALGPDVPPFFTDDEALAGALASGARQAADPLWRLPFWEPYEAMIEPGIADLDNAPSGGMAGSITAALFLRRFVTETGRFAHFDIYGWQPTAQPGRPKGGACQGARAILAALPEILGPEVLGL
ncbi:leucyl aminopeptidase family protein [Sinirhodobacter populi]|uniref:Leucyl aminopeptidase family protein n=1 Tax=Paenirhodobacter populi TaxID=2306993 RepID=A0A443KKX1_9RHOB|nr:leucyl aminopeptidase family protein [Sinirhodobacter populi]RWR33433.1 leucyl aminopeptidase family protein [Sinirhodobacter populi]